MNNANTMSLADLLSDLRYVASALGSDLRRLTDLDDDGDALIELGWIEPVGLRGRVTLDGLDVLHACRGVVLQEAA